MKLLCLSLFAASLFAAPDIKILRTPNNGIQPRAILDRAGTLHLLYYVGERLHGDLFYVKSSDLGATWSSPLRVNSEPGTAIAAGTIRGGEMVIGKNGRVHVAWNGSSNAAPGGPLNPESGQRGAPSTVRTEPDADLGFKVRHAGHKVVYQPLAKIVHHEGVTSGRSLKSGGEDNVKALKALKGAAFDKAYVDHEVAYHQAVIDAVDKTLIPSAKNAELKDLLVKTRPAFVAHLDHAKMLQAKLGK